MHNFAKFVSINRVPGSPAYLKQGVKGGRRTKGAFAGSNGSFIVQDERAKVYLRLEYNGNTFSKDIYLDIRGYVNKVYDSTCDKLEKVFKDFKFKVEDGEIVNLHEALEEALC